MKAVLTVKEFAEKLGIHEQTVYEKIRRKEIRASRIGRAIKIPMSELHKFAPDYADVKSKRETELEQENLSLKQDIEKYKELVKSINLGILRLNA